MGEVHISVNVLIVRGERCISNFVIVIYFQYFYIFGFWKVSLNICRSKTVQEYVYKMFLCSDSLFSFLHAEVIFSENYMNICKLSQNKDVQNKVLNVYCTLYSICLTRRVNVFILQVGFGVKMWMFTVGLCRKRWLMSLCAPRAVESDNTPIGSTCKPKIFRFLRTFI